MRWGNKMFENEKLKKFKEEIKGKRVAVIGLGVSNIPLVKYLLTLDAKITVFDKRPIEKLDLELCESFSSAGVIFSLGENYLENLIGFNYIFRSPSMRPDLKEVEEEIKKGAILTSEIEMLLELCPSKIIGVTGSDGKTTTTTLIYKFLNEEGYNCYLGGNIGIPLFSIIDDMKPEDIVVLELSSFQLMTCKKSPNIAVITNISPNHLDIHKDYKEYIDAKRNIYLNQDEDNLLILNYDNEITRSFEETAKAKIRYFSSHYDLQNGVTLDDSDTVINIRENGDKREVIKTSEIKLMGRHMLEDCMAAIATCKDLISINSIRKVLTTFNGVEHRNEFVRNLDGVTWRNDSIGSSPTRTIAGLNAFQDKVILIAGGYDKHLDYKDLGKVILEKVKYLILLGQTKEKIKEATINAMKDASLRLETIPIIECDTLEDAVKKAYKVAKESDIVFFSPASASFDMFKNFEERGNKFKELVNNL